MPRLAKPFLIVGLVAATAMGVGFWMLWDHRRSDENYEGSCTAGDAELNGTNRLEFDASCTLWLNAVRVVSPSSLEDFSSELRTERDVFVFGGGGPKCRQEASFMVVCTGEVDAGETFTGWIETKDKPCGATLRIKIQGGGCSDIAESCNDIGLNDEIEFKPLSACS